MIGLRFGAQVHVPAFRTDPRCVVTALAGRDFARTRSIAEELDIPSSHADWRELVSDASIDAVSIAVPPLEQGPIIVEAARLGKHVFCEKPVAASLKDAEHALASARQAGIVHAIDFIFPEIPVWQSARRLLLDGAIGAPRHFSYSWKVQTFAARTMADSWKNRNEHGGGARGNFLPHAIFNIEWLLGRLVRLDSLPRQGTEKSAFCDCIVYLEGGSHGSLSITTDAFLGEGHHLQIFGASGTLVISNPTMDYADGFELRMGTLTTGHLQLMERAPAANSDGRIAPVGQIVRRFVDGILEGNAVTPNLEDGVRIQRWLDGVSDADRR